jgi:hypothetical protein
VSDNFFVGGNMQKLIAVALLVAGFSAVAMAAPGVPEIDPASGANAVALIAGGLLILRSRRKK